MRTATFLIGLVALAAALAGCGGGGGGGDTTPTLQTTRTLAGFVYAKGNALGSGPDVVVTTSAVAPTGYFPPSSGTVTLNLADGTLTRSPDSEPFDMSISNAIVVAAKANPSTNVDITGSTIMLDGIAKGLTSYSINLGPISETGTVETIESPDAPVYTPGAPEELRFTINGNAISSANELFVAGAPVGVQGDRTLSMVGLDSNHVINPAATFTVVSETNGVLVTGSGPSVLLSPGTAANSSVEGDTTITITLVGANVTGSFLANFSYGTATVTVTPGASLLLWNTSGVAASTGIDVSAVNEFSVPVFGRPVTLTDPGKVSGNNWITQAGATAFTAVTGFTGTTGHFITTLTAPVSAVAGGGLNLTPKGANTITASVGVATGTSDVKVIRPLQTVTIVGPSRVDVATTTPAGVGTGTYHPSAGVDVDGASALLADYPALTLVYTVTNAVGGAPFGNTGDQSLPTTSTASILPGAGNENRVQAGNTAGTFAVQVTAGVPTPSNIITTDVYGDPSKIYLSPDTNTVNVIPGALGNFSGSVGSTLEASFILRDSAGHTLPDGEITYTSTFTLGSGTGGNITSGGLNVGTFSLTFGPQDGLLTIALNSGVWTGLSGTGNRQFNIAKNIGHDSN